MFVKKRDIARMHYLIILMEKIVYLPVLRAGCILNP